MRGPLRFSCTAPELSTPDNEVPSTFEVSFALAAECRKPILAAHHYKKIPQLEALDAQWFLVHLLRVERGDDKVGLQHLHDRNNRFLQSCYGLLRLVWRASPLSCQNPPVNAT